MDDQKRPQSAAGELMPTLWRETRKQLQEPAEQFRQVRTIVTPKGERLPLLMRRNGVPDYQSTAFVLVEMRARNLSCSAIDKALRAIAILYRFLQSRNVILQTRIRNGRVFTLQELDALVHLCRTHANGDATEDTNVLHWARPFGGASGSSGYHSKFVSTAVTAYRLSVIRDFVIWSIRTTNSLGADGEALISNFKRLIDSRSPPVRANLTLQREGLSAEDAQLLLDIVKPGAASNPWSNAYAQTRNHLIILWLLHLGLRRGELLGIRISDIDFVRGRVIIHRRADDIDDPRTVQPNAKTLPRELELKRELLELTENYVLTYRLEFYGSRRHDFLFVASNSGLPLSTSSITKIFRVLSAQPAMQKSPICAHLLRHTWNERFSEIVDERGVPEETEKRVRSYLMGWSDVSKSAASYTRRHIRRRAADISVALQESALARGSKK
ncbi:tyrosine-type recombinase/integrase [Herbaspirillum huttiense]|uniref:tyrosine-type recombinase/integrase n=1 Tax=Herbaspirillum huttiense TaxID=863372 RepID=UPI0039AFD1BF